MGPLLDDALSPYDQVGMTETQTDERGEARFEHLRPGPYRVFLPDPEAGPDGPPLLINDVTVAAGEQREVQLSLASNALVTVRGRIDLPEGIDEKYLPFFLPESTEGTVVMGGATTDGYEAPGLAPGRYTIVLGPADGVIDPDVPVGLFPGIEVPDVPNWVHDLALPDHVVTGQLVGDFKVANLRLVAVPLGSPTTDAFFESMVGEPGPVDAPIEPPGSCTPAPLADGPLRLMILTSFGSAPTGRRTWEPALERRVGVRGSTSIGTWSANLPNAPAKPDDDDVIMDVTSSDQLRRGDGR